MKNSRNPLMTNKFEMQIKKRTCTDKKLTKIEIDKIRYVNFTFSLKIGLLYPRLNH